MRALVISDTHFGAWTGRDLLAEERSLERLAPHLEGIDELIILGDLFDFLFASVADAFAAADGLFGLAAEKLGGGRLVFLAGNHDHHFVHRDAEDRLEAEISSGRRRASRTSRPPTPTSAPSSSAACPGSRSRSPTRPTASPTSSSPTATTSTPTPGWPARAARGC